MKARALWHDSPAASSLHAFELPEDSQGLLLLRAVCSLVSTGTERLVACGMVPEALKEAMAVPYQEGDLRLPVKYGYSMVADVVEGPPPWPGQRVHLLHPHQDYCFVRPEDCTVLPSGLPPDRAALASNLETALNAVWDGRLSAGDRVLVVGYGLIGALVDHLAARFPAVEIWVAEPNEERRHRAREHGFLLWPATGGPAVDLAFHTSASSAGLQCAIDATGRESRIVELSWYGEQPVEILLGGDFHHLRKQIISSQVSSIPGPRNTRWDYRRRKEVVLRLLEHQIWDDLIDTRIDFNDAPGVFGRVRRGEMRGLGCLIVY